MSNNKRHRLRQLPHVAPPLRRATLYYGANYIYLIGGDTEGTKYKVLRLDRNAGDKLSLRQETKVYNSHEIEGLIEKITRIETPEIVTKVYAIVGFLKLIDSYYVWVVTKGHKVGIIQGHYVYSVEKTQMFRVCNKSRPGNEEVKHQKILMNNFDLSKQFYFSYTYDLTNTLEINTAALAGSVPGESRLRVYDMFVWNAYLLRGFLKWVAPLQNDGSHAHVPQDWVVPLIHGFFRQRCFELKGGQVLRITLVARRSRYHAGTRFLKRGLNQMGFVANEVESEQIISLDPDPNTGIGAACSFVQLRGSIPLFWSHTNIMAPKPDIFVSEPDPSYAATRAHFERLFTRYGDHVTVLNLVRQIEKKPRESYLASHFAEAIGLLNEQFLREKHGGGSISRHPSFLSDTSLGSERLDYGEDNFPPLDYISYDFLTNMKRSGDKSKQVFEALMQIADAVLPQIGMFTDLGPKQNSNSPLPSRCTSPEPTMPSDGPSPPDRFLSRQTGVIRTNCIDCLDRTNVAQFCTARVALDRQMEMLGIKIPAPQIGELAKIIMEMWADHGDCISLQYGGSGAMHKVDEAGDGEEEGQRELILTGGAKNAMIAVQRYYSNNVTDYERQAAMDLFLGILIPQKGDKPGAWEKLFRSSEEGGDGTTDTDTLEQVIKEVEHDELSAAKACGELVLYRNVVGGQSSLFFCDAFDPIKLTSFNKMMAYDFEVPVLRAVPCEFVGPPSSHNSYSRRRLIPAGGAQEHRGAAAGIGTQNGQPDCDATTNTEGPTRSSSRQGRKKQLGLQEELYTKYVKLEVMLRNPLIPVKNNAVAFLPYQLGGDLYSEYLTAAEASEEAVQRTLRDDIFPPHQQRQKVFRSNHSFDDFVSLQRRKVREDLARSNAGGTEGGTNAKLTSFDVLEIGGQTNGTADGQKVNEGTTRSVGMDSSSQQGGGVGANTSAAGPSSGTEVSESRGGISKFTQFLKKLAGPNTSSSSSSSNPAPSTGSKPIISSMNNPPSTPSQSQGSLQAPPTPNPAPSSFGQGTVKGDATKKEAASGGTSGIASGNGGIGREEVGRMLEQAVEQMVEQTRRERQEDLQPLKTALERIRLQQQVLQRLLEEAVHNR